MNQQEKLTAALRNLAGVCNYASSVDGRGFNKADTEFGHNLAAQSYPLTPNQQHAALKMLQKYAGQITSAGLSLPDEADLPAREEKRNGHTTQSTQSAPKVGNGTVKLDGNVLRISFSYDPATVEKVKEIPGRAWNQNAKCWTVPLAQLSVVQKTFPDFVYDEKIAAQQEEMCLRAIAEEEMREHRATELLYRIGNLVEPQADGRTLFEHQRSAVETLVRAGRVILADDMGLGKTRTALTAAKAYQIPVYVIAPVSLRDNWLREAEMVDIAIEVFSWAKIPEAPEVEFVLIADEAHYAQAGTKSQRGKNFLALADKATACFCLTGTPIKNGRPTNLFPLLQAVKHPLAASKSAYEKRYCDAKATRWSRWDVTGAAHLDELHVKTQDVILRRMKKDCLDLPEKTRVLRQAELSAEAKKHYDETFSRLRAEYQRRLAAGEIMDGGEALVMLNHLRHAGSVAKIECAIELAQEIVEQGGSVVLFTEFTESAKQIASAFNGSAELLTGETPQADRQVMVDRFQAGKSKVFVGTIKAGGVGITLTAAQTVILADRPWTPGDAVQAEDRLHRIGQCNAVTAIWLQANGTDRAIDALLEKKQERIELVLAGKRKTMRGTGSTQEIARELAEAMFA